MRTLEGSLAARRYGHLIYSKRTGRAASNLERARAIGNVLLRPEQSGLDRESVAIVCQVMTLDDGFFDERIGSLSSRVRAKLDRGIVIALGLS